MMNKNVPLGLIKASIRAAEDTLRLANDVLEAAKRVVRTPGYIAAQGVLDAASESLVVAKQAAAASIRSAKITFDATAHAQKAIIDEASDFLDATVTREVEKRALDAAQAILTKFNTDAQMVLGSLGSAVSQSYYGVEGVAFRGAQYTLQIAKGNVKTLDAAKSGLVVARRWADVLEDVAEWASRQGNVVGKAVLDLRKVQVVGTLDAACVKNGYLQTRVWGKFAGGEFDVQMELTPRKGEEFVRRLLERLLEAVKLGIVSVGK